jgi:signal transduction histidine kinase/DNA-binding NarL/FixJ family response regulator
VRNPDTRRDVEAPAGSESRVGGRLFRKYVTLVVAVVSVALLTNGMTDIWRSYQDHKASLIRIQREQAGAAAARIGQFLKEIENQLGWMTQLPWLATTPEERRLDGLRLLRQVPAITELALVDPNGREQLHLARLALDAVGSQKDLSNDRKFTEALAHKVHYGSAYFRGESEPYMTLAVAGARQDTGVAIAEVDLKLIWDVVSQIQIGRAGQAYVVDDSGRLIAHRDISLVLRNSDLSHLTQVQAARAGEGRAPPESDGVALDPQGRRVLTAHAAITPPGWLVFAELPLDEAFAPVYASLIATGLVLLASLVLAVLASLMLARKMVTPIRALQIGASRIGKGELDHRITFKTGDELQALGDQFNSMAAQIQDSHATLERKVEERTHQLQLANLAKSRFLAAASHDLRQPLHALNLFVTQLQTERDQDEKSRLVAQIDSAVTAMNELFNALLDISKLDAGVLAPVVTEFPVERLLKRIETTFAGAARAKGLRLRCVHSRAVIRSDFILLERIILNLVSNAVRYTERGGIVIGCRHRGGLLRVDIWDSGIGIAPDQQRNIFGEFYRIAGPDQPGHGGLGLGLAIVDRLARLLDHPVALISRSGRGSRFSITAPLAATGRVLVESSVVPEQVSDPVAGKVVVVIDDDMLVLDGMRGVLRSWGCDVVTATSDNAALAALAGHERPPDLIISDYRLGDGKTGFKAIERVRRAFGADVPAFLISGDTAPDRLREASASGYFLLPKPVLPINLRATVSRLLMSPADVARTDETAERVEGASSQQPAAGPNPGLPPQ